MSNNYSQDIPYTKQSDTQEYINAFDVENESINFTTLENYSNSDYVFNANALQKVKNNIDVMQSNFDNDIISDLDDKQELFQSWVNNLSANAKPWQPGVENKYYKNDVVTHGEDPGAYFICLEDCDGTKPINYVKFINTYNNTDKFDWGVCVNGDINDENTSFIGVPEYGNFNLLKLHYEYDANYTLRFTKRDGFVGEIDYFIFKGSKEIFEHMNYVVDDSKWLRIYPKGKAGLDVFNLTYKGEWNNTVNVIDSLPSTIKLRDEPLDTNYFYYGIIVHRNDSSPQIITGSTIFRFNTPESEHKTLSDSRYGFSCDYYFDYDGSNYINVYNIINSGTSSTQKMELLRITESFGERISYQYVYVPNDIVYIKNGTNIDFYVCISEVVYDENAISPDQDTAHWIKLFTKKLDGFVILDSMPNQAWFDDDTNPSVFGVKQSDGFTIKIIDRIHSESASNPQYLKLYTVANNVVDSNNNNLNTLINNLISNTNI